LALKSDYGDPIFECAYRSRYLAKFDGTVGIAEKSATAQ
jgi:hypothetical protein